MGRFKYASCLLLLLILAIYSNAFNASWHLDDFPNIVKNPKLHMTHLSMNQLVRSFYLDVPGADAKRLYRPVARASLALNWYWGKNGVTGYHVVNVSIHCITAVLIFTIVWTLFQTPQMQKEIPPDAYFVALLTAALWAINPIQTQAVTYIVQRMAALAAMFTAVALYLYLRGRLCTNRVRRWWFWGGTLLGFVLALGSKENAIMLPLSLILVEFCFFQDLARSEVRKRLLGIVAVAGLALVLCGYGLLYLKKGDPLAFVRTMYANRPFTLAERLLTEPRILILYLSQIFYPMPQRLSVEHDVVISTSLTVPWTTLPAIGLVLLLIGLGISQMRSRPMIAFALLFFFINHLPESSIFPLELVFEHRNYLPSLFIFLPVAAAVSKGIAHYRMTSKPMAYLITMAVTLTILGLGYSTYLRNATWATQTGLWQDALTKAPGSGRIYHNLAAEFYQPRGEDRRALAFYRRALESYRHKPANRGLTLTNMGYIYLKQGEYQRSLKYFRAALQARPAYGKAYRGMVRALIQLKRWNEALDVLNNATPRGRGMVSHSGLLARIYLARQAPEKAIPVLDKQIQLNPLNWKAYFYKGVAFESMGKHEQSQVALRYSQILRPQQPEIGLALALSLWTDGKVDAASRVIKLLVDAIPLERIDRALKRNRNDDRQQLLNYDPVAEILATCLKQRSRVFRQMTLDAKPI